MADLVDSQLFSNGLPAAWHPLIDGIAAFDAAVARGDDQAAQSLRAGLMRDAHAVREPLPTLSEFWHGFSEAVLLWPRFAEAGGRVLTNTLEASRLPDFPVDLRASDSDRANLRAALARLSGLSATELCNIEAKLAHQTSNLTLKVAITQHLSERMIGDPAAAACTLMCQLYGQLPWRPGDVDVVITSAAVFFCLPEDVAGRAAPEQQALESFIARARREHLNIRNARFPAFGLFDGTSVAPTLVQELTSAVRAQPGLERVGERLVVETLTTMVTLLPKNAADQFLIHDMWGHGWQESLCEFEWAFRDLPNIARPIEAFPLGTDGPALVDAFARQSGRCVLVPSALFHFVERDLRARITLGLNLVIAECLADLVEHKFARRGRPLPSSSRLPTCPLRLDLSLADARRMLRLWRRPYLELVDNAGERDRLQRILRAAGAPEQGLAVAIDEAVALISDRFAIAFDDSTAVQRGSDVRVNVLQRILLSLVTFESALEHFLGEADRHRRSHHDSQAGLPCPVASIDLLVLLLGCFYERQRAKHVWHLDELLTQALGPALLRLEAELYNR